MQKERTRTMSTSSSASSRLTNRRSVCGVPLRCWCGRNITTYGSQIKVNLFRRFYICEVALQRKNEEHLFKWVDEALLDETRMVEAKHLSLVEEVKELRGKMVEKLEPQDRMIQKMQEEVKAKVEERMKEEIMMAAETLEKMARERAKTSMEKVGITI